MFYAVPCPSKDHPDPSRGGVPAGQGGPENVSLLTFHSRCLWRLENIFLHKAISEATVVKVRSVAAWAAQEGD